MGEYLTPNSEYSEKTRAKKVTLIKSIYEKLSTAGQAGFSETDKGNHITISGKEIRFNLVGGGSDVTYNIDELGEDISEYTKGQIDATNLSDLKRLSFLIEK